jgi:hypothetical protein
MRPTDIDLREVLNAPEWTERELRNLICICEEKIMQLYKARK